MATRYAVANGNWSSTSTWDGTTTIPSTGDIVHANGFTVTIDQDINMDSLRTTSGSGIAAGGGFTVSAGGRSITLTNATTGLWPGTTNVLTLSHTTGTATVTGTVKHNGATNSVTALVLSGSGGTTTITGSIEGGASSGTRVAISVSAAHTVNIVGGLNTQGSPVGVALSLASTLGAAVVTINITGNITAGGGGGGSLVLSGGQDHVITVTGNLTGGPGGQAAISLGSIRATVTVNGSVTASTGQALNGTGVQVITVNGNVSASTDVGISLTGAATVTVNGTVTASSSACAVEATNASATFTGTGPFANNSTSGRMAVFCRLVVLDPVASDYWRFLKQGGGTVDLVSTDSLADLPAASDVRAGTVYASGALTGTCAVPAAGAVANGVAVDDTVGTAILTAADIWAVAKATAGGTADSIGEHLAAAATVDDLSSVAIDPTTIWDVDIDDVGTAGTIGERLKTAATTAEVGAIAAAFEQTP